MNLMMVIYLASVAASIKVTLMVIATLALVIVAITTIVAVVLGADPYPEEEQEIKFVKSYFKYLKFLIGVPVLMIFVSTFIPSSETSKLMIGAYVADRVLDDPKFVSELSDLPANAVKGLNVGLTSFTDFARGVTDAQ